MANAVKEETKRVSLNDIHVDFSWNCRQGRWQDEKPGEDGKIVEGPQGGTGFLGLIESIKLNGQDDAVDVIPNPTKSKHPYFLVTGFRRYEALRRISEDGVSIKGSPDPKNPTILVNIKNLTPVEARARNARENIERDNISTADVAHTVAELGSLGLNDSEISLKIGKSAGYVGILHNIMRGTHKDLLKQWRETPVDPLTLKERTAIANMPNKNEQQAAFDEALKGKKGKKRSGGGQGAWMKTAVLAAEAIGALLGSLERGEFISTESLDFAKDIQQMTAGGLLRVGKKGATEKQWEKLAEVMTEAYNKALEAEPETEEGETPPTAGNKKGNKAA